MDPAATLPRFAPGVKFRLDEVRQAWVVLAPERLFVPDPIATEVLRRIDGQRTVQAIIDDLASAFDAPRERIASDVHAMLADLVERQVLRLQTLGGAP